MTQIDYITEDFLLETEEARILFHEYAKALPIIDYHCHLPAQEVASNRHFENMTQIWLAGDHYKWRAMRANGVPEQFCTGDASDWEKFEKWAETVPYLLRNQLYSWTHLELKTPFGITGRLFNSETAPQIWSECNERLSQPEFSARGIMRHMNVAMVGTTDDPVDTLDAHWAVAADPSFPVLVLPTWRPDKSMAVESPDVFLPWLEKLRAASGVDILNFDTFLEALRKRQDFFAQRGCRMSDHGISALYNEPYTDVEINGIFAKARDGRLLDSVEVAQFKTAMLYELCKMNHEKGWAQQLHIGPIRNNNTRQYLALGPDTGYDSIGDTPFAAPLARLLDRLEQAGALAKTVLYTINPTQNMVLATMIGNFQDGLTPGKMQFGSGWWFNDQKDGMERQMEDLSQVGLLSRFVGMLTDSRSFLSYPRHEYFRRILCNMLGNDMAKGTIPHDLGLAGRMVRDISYNNAVRYFELDLPLAEGKGTPAC